MSTLKNINLSTLPDITDVQDNFNILNNDKLEVGNIIQGENITLTVDGKNIIISSTSGGGGTGIDGVSLQYVWDGTSLGIKREDETEYTYVDLKGTGSGSSLVNIFDGNANGAVRTKNCLNDYQMGYSAFAEGVWAMAKGYASHAEGNDTQAEGFYSHAEGFMTYAKGESSHSEGANTSALAPHSHSEGYVTTASGFASHAGGRNTKAVGEASTVIGKYGNGTVNTLFGVANGTVGNLKLGFEIRTDNTMWLNGVQITGGGGGASLTNIFDGGANGSVRTKLSTEDYAYSMGEGAFAEGIGTEASGVASHAEGNYTYAEGVASHTEGYGTWAIGDYSHSEGMATEAIGVCSHTGGYVTRALRDNSTVIGQFGVGTENTLFAVANGISEEDMKLGLEYRDDDTLWLDGKEITSNEAFTTVDRPVDKKVGFTCFDTSLGKPIWLKTIPSTWVDANGIVV